MNKIYFVLTIFFSVLIWCDSEIKSKVSMASSGIINSDDRISFEDHLGDVIFLEEFATT